MPDGTIATEVAFLELTEELMRLALRRALSIAVGETDGSLTDWESWFIPG
jgi:hypothetical protein